MIERSARALSRDHYSDVRIEAAITHVFGVDRELVADGSYFVADWDGGLAGCGGRSRRATLFGGDRFASRSSGALDSARDAACIRAFFVSLDHARRGVGTALLAACEDAARGAGFRRATLMATLPGGPFYSAHGYVAEAQRSMIAAGSPVPFVMMSRILLRKCNNQ
ncbi:MULTISPECIES: GNAT family N-acetyltransferase [unclassified Sphingomonas]|uniref:GNAT family N-acetyltransferase n=1 Tax=unclassified Sphingomonas TaxID=196159 RepID=UPI001E4F93A7|nr:MULTISPECIES: GNAT family N-acetyltransferase [unclassified Sphingomonas]